MYIERARNSANRSDPANRKKVFMLDKIIESNGVSAGENITQNETRQIPIAAL
jgi:hypothetical protein